MHTRPVSDVLFTTDRVFPPTRSGSVTPYYGVRIHSEPTGFQYGPTGPHLSPLPLVLPTNFPAEYICIAGITYSLHDLVTLC